MLRFAILRILSAIPTLLFVILLAFLLVHAAPGGPFGDLRGLSPEIRETLEQKFHLDKSLPEQFFHYVSNVLRGDFGPSMVRRGDNVSDLIRDAYPTSFLLGSLSILVALAIGITLGVTAALRRNSAVDRLVSAIAMTGISIPVIVVAPLLVVLFAVQLRWLPASYPGAVNASWLVLPVLALALPQIAYITRLIRASMIEVLESDYVRTARAQGLSTANIVLYHAIKPAMLPLLSYLGPAIAAVLTGSMVVEQIFGIPGLGQFFVNGALGRDYTLVMGLVIFYATLIIVLNLFVDLLYGVIDPRIVRR